MTKFTPGPWFKDVVTGSAPRYRIVALTSGGKVDVLNVYEAGQPDDSATEANVRLAAAAPDLLEALASAERALAIAASYRPITRGTDGDRINAALTTARRALAKARGES